MSRRAAWTLAGLLALASPVPLAASAEAAPGCAVSSSGQNWGTGFLTTLEVTNNGLPVDGWTLRFAFTGGYDQRVVHGWNATWTQSGAEVAATSLRWNASLPTNGSVRIGFVGARTPGTMIPPTWYTLNGVLCSGGFQMTTPPSPSVSPPPPRPLNS